MGDAVNFDLANLFGEDTCEDVSFDGVVVQSAAKQGKAAVLLADAVFNPALVLVEQIVTGNISVKGRRLIDISCGTGIVGLVGAKHGAAVVLTEYNNPDILQAVRQNIASLRETVATIDLKLIPYTWGTKHTLGTFDLVILSDLLWYIDSHVDLLACVIEFLAVSGQAYVCSGKYTKRSACESFLRLAEQKMLKTTEIKLGQWSPSCKVSGVKNLDLRKDNVWMWKLSWQDTSDASTKTSH